MLALLALTALADDAVTGTAFGRPFHAVTALAAPSAQVPGVLQVAIVDGPLACHQKASKKRIAMILAFEPAAGSVASQALFISAKDGLAGPEGGTATLVAFDNTAGSTGRVHLEYTGASALSGDMTFTLCDAVVPPKPLDTAWPVSDVALDDLKVAVGQPAEWTSADQEAGTKRWIGPDGQTSFELSASCQGGCDPASWADNAKGWAASALATWGTAPMQASATTNSEVSPGVYVLRWTTSGPGFPETAHLDVFVWGPDWPTIAHCQAQTPVAKSAFLDTIEPVCRALTRAE
jgi:hypothetical protein